VIFIVAPGFLAGAAKSRLPILTRPSISARTFMADLGSVPGGQQILSFPFFPSPEMLRPGDGGFLGILTKAYRNFIRFLFDFPGIGENYSGYGRN
jgi:hypothetical protein